MKYLYTITIIFLSVFVFGQKADKVFKNFEKKDYVKAEEQFFKIIEKDTANCAANFGLAYIYSTEESQKVDYFRAWDHFRVAYRNQDKLDAEDAEAIKLHIATIDPKRRSRPLNKNFDLEKEIIQDKLITYVREENDLEIALKFIEEYPTSDYIENVYHIRNYIEFRKAENANTVAGYNLFLQKYPDAAQSEKVKELRNKKAYAEAKATGTFSAINDFIEKYPDAFEKFEAESLRNKLAFAEAKKVNTLKAIENFIEKYPTSVEVAEAMQIKRQLLFEQAKSVNTLEAYNNFVKLYPEGKQFVDIFNLKANVLENAIKQNNEISFNNALYYKGFDRNQMDDILKDVYMLNNKTLVAGKTKIEEDNWDAWIIALDNEGKMLWNKSFGQNFNDGINCIAVAKSGNIYLGGIMNAVNDTIKGVSWVVKMSETGQILWSKTLKAAKIKAISIDDNENIYAGGSYFDSTSYNCALFRLDMHGETIWTRKYMAESEIESVFVKNENEIIFSGGNWIVNVSNEGYINTERLLTEINSPVIAGLQNEVLYYAGIQDSIILHYGALNQNFENLWNKKVEFDRHIDIHSFQVSSANMHLLLSSEAELTLYDFNFEGEELTKKIIQKTSFKKKAVYKQFNGISTFGGTSETFGQKDMFLIKFQ